MRQALRLSDGVRCTTPSSRPRRTRRRSTTVLALACAAVVAACSVPALASAAPEDNTYVALGDSLAYGWGASSPDTKGYVGLLYSDYQSSLGVTQLYNLGLPGATSTSLRYGGQLATALALINASSDTRAVTIDIGYNDGCVFTYGAETCPFRANLAAVLGDLQAALGSDPGEEAFSEMLYYNPGAGTPSEGFYDRLLFGDNLSLGCSDTGANAGLNDVIAQEAGRLGIPLANPYPAFKQNGQAFVGPDQLHPNDAGYAAIEHAFLNVGLLCSSAPIPASVTLTPPNAVNDVGTSHTVTATATDSSGQPVQGVTILFKVSGADNVSGQCTTDANGQCSFTYQGPNLPGTDLITGCADNNSNGTAEPGEPCGTATKAWVLPSSTPRCSVTQGGQISANNGDKANFGGNARSNAAGGAKGQEAYHDQGPAQPQNVKSIQLLALTCNQQRTLATIFGRARISGSGAYHLFRIDVQDLGEPGVGRDTYRILLDTGYDSGQHTLEGGNVQIHG